MTSFVIADLPPETTGVWWDINTCPIPNGFDPGHVLPSIEWAMRDRPDGPVTIFCVGDLELVPLQDLKALSSSGILMRQATLCGIDLYHLLCEWKEFFPPPSDIVLISGDASWFSSPVLALGYTIVSVFSDPRPLVHHTFPSDEEWDWKTLLEENSHSTLANTKSHILPAYFCTVCDTTSQSSFDFLNHVAKLCSSVIQDQKNKTFYYCHLCPCRTYSRHEFTNHFKTEEHAQFIHSDPWAPRTFPIPDTVLCRMNAFRQAAVFHHTVGVWWDLNTCPVPRDFEPRRVLLSIESALKMHLAPNCPVTITIFCVGNLELVSPRLLEEISSSGILLIHSPSRGRGVLRLLNEWKKRNPAPGAIMLISGDCSWYGYYFLSLGYTVLRAFPSSWPARVGPSFNQWHWETLLKENCSGTPVKTNGRILQETGNELACSCIPCKFHTQSCDGFIEHFKSTKHHDELWNSVPMHTEFGPVFYCNLCEYPGHDLYNMVVHFNSEKHALNLRKLVPVGKNDRCAFSCNLCIYSGSNLEDMAVHFNSEEHACKLWKLVPVDKNYRPAFDCYVCDISSKDLHEMAVHFNSEKHALNECAECLAEDMVERPSECYGEESPQTKSLKRPRREEEEEEEEEELMAWPSLLYSKFSGF